MYLIDIEGDVVFGVIVVHWELFEIFVLVFFEFWGIGEFEVLSLFGKVLEVGCCCVFFLFVFVSNKCLIEVNKVVMLMGL